MPAVPEILLRKLYVQGSLTQGEDGFAFLLKNTLLAVTITHIGINVDGVENAADDLSLQLDTGEKVQVSRINSDAPFPLPLNVLLQVRVRCGITRPKKLTLEAETLEVGMLKFSVELQKSSKTLLLSQLIFVPKMLGYFSRMLRTSIDPLHPIYHFTPPANWMNDPNGLVSWQGKTHLFYQYNPSAAVWGWIHWGHAESPDLVHWRRLPIAMRPQAETPNADGCWSGSAVQTDDGPIFIYTAVFPETVCLARPDKTFRRLINDADNPVNVAPPAGEEIEGFRDPCVWREGDDWYMTIGSGFKGKGGAVLLYRSTDLKHWEYLHPLLSGDSRDKKPFPTGTMWECPQLFSIDDQYFLFISAIIDSKTQYTIYYQGKMNAHRFIPASLHLADQGEGTVYAPLTFKDDKRRRILFGWIKEERDEAACRKAGWSGALTLPRQLSVSESGELLIEPVEEVTKLRTSLIGSTSETLSERPLLLSRRECVKNIELTSSLKVAEKSTVTILLAESENAQEQTRIRYDRESQTLSVDTRTASLDPLARGSLKECLLSLRPDETLDLRIFLDGSVIEVYANRKVVLTSRIYPTRPNGLRVYASADKGKVEMVSTTIHKMGSCF
jgi:beta-fructofuranosidase